MFKLRQVKKTDLPFLDSLIEKEQAMPVNWNDNSFIQTIVIEDQGELVACSPIQFVANELFLPFFFVHQVYLRKGIAQHMFEKVKKIAKANQIKNITMATGHLKEETIYYYKERLVMELEGDLLVLQL
ncbi:GNAT family N-acetyltransferase [Radiobacillus deserti]|uniref:GNAT family N-acetyltransferase n=1 Tax=Radiobacillus deserti TaxID=2594883 RepID=A0A516KCC6_9BACI|nr:GNAT family N-acetyltransferase [Radiobacillus deserti]QDP39065.1 GNAT family N-acetyltransferase [Radiobacillus deserti]